VFVRMMILDRLAWLWVDTSGLPTDNWHHFLRLIDTSTNEKGGAGMIGIPTCFPNLN
jgi:hypothetical protein